MRNHDPTGLSPASRRNRIQTMTDLTSARPHDDGSGDGNLHDIGAAPALTTS